MTSYVRMYIAARSRTVAREVYAREINGETFVGRYDEAAANGACSNQFENRCLDGRCRHENLVDGGDRRDAA